MSDAVKLNCPECHGKETVCGTFMVDPGVRTFSNGDPGYPGSEELDVDPCILCGWEPEEDDYDALHEEAHEYLDRQAEIDYSYRFEEEPEEEP